MKSLLAVVWTACVLLFSAQAPPSTLRQVLADDGMNVVTPGNLPNLDKPITSGSSVKDSTRYVLAYYLNDGTNALNGPLFIEVLNRMFDPLLFPVVGETFRELLENSRPLLDFPQQQSTGVRTDLPTIEMTNHFTVT